MMNRKMTWFSRGLSCVLAAVMLLSPLMPVQAAAAGYDAGGIKRLDGVSVDYTKYLNENVMYKLPDSVRDDEEISVIVTTGEVCLMDAYENSAKTMSFGEFTTGTTEAEAVRAAISGRKAELLARLDELELPYTVGEEYDTLLSGFELMITASDFAELCTALEGNADVIVSEVYHTAETKLVENTVNVYDTGIFNSSASGYDGSGMVVAVLDTGLDSNHTAFSVSNFTSDHLGLTKAQVAEVLDKTTANKQAGGLSVEDVYVNEKVPFGYDYADNDPDVYSTHNNHGTHVSGVIVGKDDVITGVAPNAQLVSMKIFSDVVDTARASWILSALEDCVVLGVDVINMSLGTACGFSRESDEEKLSGVYDKIRDAGISLIVAASNSFSSAYGSEANGNLALTSNPDTGTVGSPATYQGAMSVASINGVETPYILHDDTIIYFIESSNGTSEENNFFDTLLGDQDKVEMEFVLIPGVGRSADYTGLDIAGKIALVRRGSNTFEEKAIIAEAQGAAGIIVYNNVSGDIKMNVGDAKLACCSISQDDGEMLAALGSGKLTISREQTSGPFMSDFSSWGPSPDLSIKPEITAHGGNILSSITGGSYDRISGTSMACPNLAGVMILLRQYVVENFPEIADDNAKVNAMANRLVMSTADIVFNTNGLPYAVRKQGAGLANLASSLETPANIITYDKDGKIMDTAKLELGHDPEKTGIYEMSFSVDNFGDKDLTYTIGSYVMTEGVSDTKTNAGKTTITEEAVLLSGAVTEVVSVEGGTLKGNKLTVDAGACADVKVKVTLSDSDKEYLNNSFENGMYVEGFITLTAEKGTKVNLNVPFLAYYGNWLVAPLFDLDYYATNADELDDAIDPEDKIMADAYATRPIGGVYDDYVSYLGSYYFIQDPDDMQIAASRDYIALSNQIGTIHSLRYVWAGLLRNARRVDITITDDTTGEVIFEKESTDVRKSYSDGGASIYPANVEIEFDTTEYNLKNNTRYNVRLVGYLDSGDGGLEENLSNTFEFPMTIDFEAPVVTDTEFYYEYDDALKMNRLYAKVGIYDNHYTMSSQLGYVVQGTDENGEPSMEMIGVDQYLTPVYSKENSTTYVTYELTDYIYKIKEEAVNKNSFVLTVYDYALNYATYEINLPDDIVSFVYDGLEEGLTMSPNEVFNLEPLVYPETEWAELLEFTSSRPSVVRVVNNKIIACAPGNAVIKIRNPQTGDDMTFKVTVLKEGDEDYRRYDQPVADKFSLDGYKTLKAYYVLDSNEKKIGDTGDVRFFEGDFNLSLYPSETVQLRYTLDSYFPNDTTVAFETSNENIVTIDESGIVRGVAEGFASVTMKVLLNDRSTYYSETVSVEVKDPYITTGPSLTHYFGNGGLVVVPADKHLTEIGNFSFANFDYVLKTEEELAIDDKETSKMWYIGENTVTKVVLPEGIEKIGSYAFANLTALEEIVLPSTLEAIEYGAFYGCTSLQKISFSGENNLKIINQNAFENCDLQGTVDLSSICVISDYAFAGNQDLEGIVTSDTLLSVGRYAFAGCKKLEDVTITASKVKYGAYAFTGCESLTEFYVNASVLPEGMFYEAESMTKVTIGPDVNEIGEFAFRDTKVAELEVTSGNKAFKIQKADYVISADGTALIAVAPVAEGTYTADNIGGAKVTAVADGAFSHNTVLTSVSLPEVTTLGDYAFGSSTALETVELGQLTKIGEYAFFETLISVMPAFTADTEIGKYAFSHTALTSVAIPDGMTVAEGCFSECMKLEQVTVGNNVTLEDFAFSLNKDKAFHLRNYDDDSGIQSGKRFYYEFWSPMKSLTIGENAVIGKNVFSNAASLENVSLSAGADIGYMAFYNCASLKEIDLSAAKKIGDYAFSGDVYYVCYDENMTVAAVSPEGTYLYTYHAPALESLDLSAAEYVGEHAFSYCRQLKDVKLNDAMLEIPQYAFAGCIALEEIDLSRIVTVGQYAFIESGLVSADLSAAETIGEYAFVSNKALTEVTMNPAGIVIDEGVFSECNALTKVHNMNGIRKVGDYAFAYTAVTDADLSGAEHIGDQAFLKKELTPFTVKLGENLETLGDNPFALCKVAPFSLDLNAPAENEIPGIAETEPAETESLAPAEAEETEPAETAENEETETVEETEPVAVFPQNLSYTFDISDKVTVIDGSLYAKIDTGLELITYAGINDSNVKIADNTVRISALAFACSDVKMVTLPVSLAAIGHKAFFDCGQLQMVIFGSYNAPILEEEFDSTYYDSFKNLPGIGDYGTYTDYDGEEVPIEGIGVVPYYMWNITDGMYFDMFYGANFVDYVGKVEEKLAMIRPVNGKGYDSFIYGNYFELTLDGPAAPDDAAVAAIKAIDAIPDRVTYEDRAYVEAARAAYSKVATTLQQALVTNYADLISAEQRITALTPAEEGEGTEEPAPTEPAEEKSEGGSAGVILCVLVGVVAMGAAMVMLIKKRKSTTETDEKPEEAAQETPAAEPEEAAQEDETPACEEIVIEETEQEE